MTNLKDYRDKELPLFIVANVLLFLVVHKIISFDMSNIPAATKVFAELFESAVLSAIAFGFILVTECLFTSGLKDKLLFLFGLFKQPGSTIFTKIMERNPDNRFSFQNVKDKYPKLYDELPKDNKAKLRYENEQWYSIYNQNRDVSMIHHSQRDWLLCRDIYISVLLMIVMYAIAALADFIAFNGCYLGFLIAVLVITNIGANRKAARFSFNVIAYDLTKPDEKEKK
jgi:hypothetical protein